MPLDTVQRRDSASAFKQAVTDVALTEAASWTRPDLGPLGFDPLAPAIDQIQRASRVLSQLPLEELPPAIASQGLQAYGAIQPLLREAATFDVMRISQQGNNPVQAQQSLLSRFDNVENQFWLSLMPVLGYAAGWNLETAPSEAESEVRSALESLRGASVRVTREQEQLAAIVAAARAAAAEVGVSKHAGLFAEEAKSHEESAGRWLKATALSAGVTLLAVVLNFLLVSTMPAQVSGAVLVQISLAKILLFSLLLTSTLWCGRVYRVARHNAIVNKHRQNALSSFETFVEGSKDEQTRNAVLLHAAQSIFAPQSSGFTSGDNESSGAPNIVELVRTITSAPK